MAFLVNSITTDNMSLKTVIDSYKTEFSNTRSIVSAALASLQAAQTAWQTARKNLDYKLAGASVSKLSKVRRQ